MDNQSSGMAVFLPDDNRITFVGMDIDKMDKLNFVINQHEFDYVFHLAAHFANQNSVDHPFSDIQTNIVGTVSLLEILKFHKSLKKFVFISQKYPLWILIVVITLELLTLKENFFYGELELLGHSTHLS